MKTKEERLIDLMGGRERAAQWLATRHGGGGRNDCWRWLGGLSPSGYGKVHRKDGDAKIEGYAPRVAWVVANGRPVPPGTRVYRSCEWKDCVNPAHLDVRQVGQLCAECRQRTKWCDFPRIYGPRGRPHWKQQISDLCRRCWLDRKAGS